MRGLLNCRKRSSHQRSFLPLGSSFGPYCARRFSISLVESPFSKSVASFSFISLSERWYQSITLKTIFFRYNKTRIYLKRGDAILKQWESRIAWSPTAVGEFGSTLRRFHRWMKSSVVQNRTTQQNCVRSQTI